MPDKISKKKKKVEAEEDVVATDTSVKKKKKKKTKKSKKKAEEVVAGETTETTTKKKKKKKKKTTTDAAQGNEAASVEKKKKKKKKAKSGEDAVVKKKKKKKKRKADDQEPEEATLPSTKKSKATEEKSEATEETEKWDEDDDSNWNEHWDGGKAKDTTKVKGETPAPSENTRVYVGNLSFKIEEDTMKNKFGAAGEIEHIHWVTDKESGKFYGTAFIDYADAKSAAIAVAYNGDKILGRPLKVNYATGGNHKSAARGNNKAKKGQHILDAPLSERPDGCTTVFLGNLNFQITEEALRQVLDPCGDLKEVRWIEKDGEFKGCGFAEFWETEAVDKAVKLNGHEVMGRPMRVDYSASR